LCGRWSAWYNYAGSLLAFSLMLLTYLIQRIQEILPLNPQDLLGKLITPDQALHHRR
jgi:K+-transporting ATPase A subunit